MRHSLTLTTADGAETVALSVPTTWDDVSLQQYIDWQCSAEAAIIVLSGITPAQLDRLAWRDASYLLNLLAFAAELPDPPLSEGLPDVGACSYGTLLLVNAYLEANPGKPDVWYAPYFYALYRHQQVYGKYDEGKLEQMRLAILEEPVGKCLNDVLFCWAGWLLSMRDTSPPPPTLPSPTMTSWMQGLRNWARGLGRTSPSTALPRPGA